MDNGSRIRLPKDLRIIRFISFFLIIISLFLFRKTTDILIWILLLLSIVSLHVPVLYNEIRWISIKLRERYASKGFLYKKKSISKTLKRFLYKPDDSNDEFTIVISLQLILLVFLFVCAILTALFLVDFANNNFSIDENVYKISLYSLVVFFIIISIAVQLFYLIIVSALFRPNKRDDFNQTTAQSKKNNLKNHNLLSVIKRKLK